MEEKKPVLLLVDGSALIHRAFHALPPLTTKTGEPVGAVYGFASMLLRAIGDLKPSHSAVAFDKKGPTFRHEMFDQYKAHRAPTDPELVKQFGRVKDLVRSFEIPVFELDGYEADDIIGAISKQATEQGLDTIILTGDADMMQLVSPSVRVFYPKARGGFSEATLFDAAAVKEKYGVDPSQIAHLKALKGDASDNIPGVPGVGEKTALKLIQEFGTVENMLDNMAFISPPKLQEKIRDNVDAAKQSLVLATIDQNTPVELNLEECCKMSHYDRNRVVETFRELGFNSLLYKLPQSKTAQPQTQPQTQSAAIEVEEEKPVEIKYETISDFPALEAFIKRLEQAKYMAVSTEASGKSLVSASITGISLSPAAGEACYIPAFSGEESPGNRLQVKTVLDLLKPVLGNKALPKYLHNGKNDLILLEQYGTKIENFSFDTMLAAYLLGDKALGLKEVVFDRLHTELTPSTDLTGKGSKQIPLFQVEVEQVSSFACANADMTGRLAKLLRKELKEKDRLNELFEKVEMPLVPVLAYMELCGVKLDTDLLQEMSADMGAQLEKLEEKIYEESGEKFNINSPAQMGVVLFEKMNLPGKKSKGKYSTDASVLEGLRGHAVVDAILEYRQLMKLKSTYVDALPELIDQKTERVHTTFNQMRTTTGRLSSSDPNLQNIPVRGELGKEIRKAFIAPPGYILVAGDYSQIDLRALAHLSEDPNLLEAFRNDKDIHSATAAQLFGVDIKDVKPDMRRLAKTVNFGVIYGMSQFGLEQATELTRAQAAEFIDAYFKKYPGVAAYLENTKAQARRLGYVETILGRRRYIPEINSGNRFIKESAERMAINMPVQGTSSDIIKIAMIDLFAEMKRRQLKSRMVLQVHDELIFEVPEDEMDEMALLVPGKMSSAIELKVPLKVDIKSGFNWGEMD